MKQVRKGIEVGKEIKRQKIKQKHKMQIGLPRKFLANYFEQPVYITNLIISHKV